MKLIKSTDLVEGDYIFVYDGGRSDYIYLGFCRGYGELSYMGSGCLEYEEIVAYTRDLETDSEFHERRSNKRYMTDNSEFYYKLTDDEIVNYIVMEVV